MTQAYSPDDFILDRVGGQSGLASKLQDVTDARHAKLTQLTQYAQSVDQNAKALLDAQENRKKSWVNQLGLDSVEGQADIVDGAAALWTGIGRTAGTSLTAAPDVLAMQALRSIPEDVLAAYSRTAQGKALPGDEALLGSSDAQRAFNDPSYQWNDTDTINTGTYRDRIESALNMQRGTKAMSDAFDWSSTIDPTNKDILSRSLGRDFQENYDRASVGATNLSKGNIVAGMQDLIPAAAKLFVDGLGAVGDNPVALSQYVLENSPQLAMGMAKGGSLAMGQSNLGYAVNTFAEGIRKYQEENGGALPSAEEIQEKAMQSLSLAAAEQAGDMLTLGAAKLGRGVKDAATNAKDALKNVGKGTTEAVEAAGEATESAARQQLKAALSKASEAIANSAPARALKATGDAVGGAASKVGKGISAVGDSAPGRVMKATAGGFASEAPTEAYQTYMEGEITGEKASPFEVYAGAVIGGASGGTVSGSINATAEAAKEISVAAEKARKAAEERRITAENEKNAIEKGDVSPYINPEKEGYAPLKAMDYLNQYVKAEGRTEEEKAEALEKSQGILNDITQGVAAAEGELSDLSLAGWDKRIANVDAMVANISDPALQEKAAAYREKLVADRAKFEKDISDPASDTAKAVGERTKQVSERIKALKETQKQVADLHKAYTKAWQTPKTPEQKAAEAKVAKAEVDQTIKDLKTPVPESDGTEAGDQAATTAQSTKEAAVEKVLAMSLGNFASPDLDKLAKVVNNLTRDPKRFGLSNEQVNRLKTFSEARQAYNAVQSLDSVNNTVLNGDGRNKGIAQYRTDMRSAIEEGDGRKAMQALGGLARWASNHASKAKAMNAAQAQFASTGKSVQIFNDSGDWKIHTGSTSFTREQIKAGQANDIGPNSANLIDLVNKEAAALSAAEKELRQAYQAKFGGKGSVQNVSKQPVQQSKPQGAGQPAPKQPQATPASAGSSAGKAGAVGSSSARSGGNQSAGQAEPAVEKAPQPKQAEKAPESVPAPEVSEKTPEASGSAVKSEQPKPKETKAQRKRREARERHEAAQQAQTTQQPQKTSVEESQKTQEQAAQAQRTEARREASIVDDPLGENPPVESYGDIFNNVDENTDEDISVAPEAATVESEASEQDTDTTQPDNTEEDTDTEVVEGKLRALEATTPDLDLDNLPPMPERLPGDLFKQKDGPRPLVRIHNFFSQLMKKRTTVSEFVTLSEDSDIQQKQKDLIRLLKDKLLDPKWIKNLNAQLATLPQELQYKDPATMLVEEANGKLSIPENVRTAVVVGIFSHIGEAGNNARMPNEDINAMLLRDKAHPVTREEREILGHFSTMETNALRIGERAVAALGIEESAAAPEGYSKLLAASLGNLAVKFMAEQGLLETRRIPSAVLEQLSMGEAVAQDDAAWNGHQKATLVALAHDPKTAEFKGEVAQINKAIKETRGILQDFFGIEQGVRMPSLEPVKHHQNSTPTGMKVPALLQKTMATMSQRGWTTAGSRFTAWDRIADNQNIDRWLDMAGWKDPADVHVDMRESQEATNDEIVRQLELFDEFMQQAAEKQEDFDTPAKFYFTYEAWVQQRIGIKNNAVNPQGNKMVRWLIAMPEWETEVEVPLDLGSDPKGYFYSFVLRVAEGLGEKPERNHAEVTFNKVMARVKEPNLRRGIDALKKIVRKEDLTEADKDNIVDAVKTGKEKVHTFAALHAWAEYEVAKESAEEGKPFSFKTMLAAEVDGIANGSMLNMMLYGAGNLAYMEEKMAMGGFFTEASGDKQYNTHRGNDLTRKDIYQKVVEKVGQRLEQFFGPKGVYKDKFHTGTIYTAFKGIFGDISKDRNFPKGGMNPMNFGSGMGTIRRKSGEYFLEKLYDKIADLRNSGAEQEEVSAFIMRVNTLIKNAGLAYKDKKTDEYVSIKVDPLPTNLTAEQLHERPLTGQQRAAISKAITNTVGVAFAGGFIGKKHIDGVLAEEFDQFLTHRNAAVNAGGIAFNLYDGVFQARMRAKLIEQGVPFFGGAPAWGLTKRERKALEKELQHIRPIMQTMGSLESGNDSEAVLLGKMDKSPIGEVTSRFPEAGKFGSKEVTTSAGITALKAPGVVPASAGTHSLDSFGMHKPLQTINGLGIHDAALISLKDVASTAKALNKTVWEALLAYNPVRETTNALVRTIGGIVHMMESGNLSEDETLAVTHRIQSLLIVNTDAITKEAQRRENKAAKLEARTPVEVSLEGVSLTDQLELLVSYLDRIANTADFQKFQMAEQMGAVDQYHAIDGFHEVTPENRAEAGRLKEAAAARGKRGLPKEVLANITKLGNAVEALKDGNSDFLQLNSLPRNEAIQLATGTGYDPDVDPDVHTVLDEVATTMQKRGGAYAGVTETIAVVANKVAAKLGTTAADLRQRVMRAMIQYRNNIPEDYWAPEDTTEGKPAGEFSDKYPTHPELKAFFEKSNPKDLNAQSVLGAVKNILKKDKDIPNRAVLLVLAERLELMVSPDTPVFYITPSTLAGAVDRRISQQKAGGWYSMTKDHIALKSAEYRYSYVSPETVIHEALHAVLARVFKKPLSERSPAEQALVDDINGIFDQALKFVTKPGNEDLITKFENALSNVDEFVSWGLTNAAFQQEVLMHTGLPMDGDTGFRSRHFPEVRAIHNQEAKNISSQTKTVQASKSKKPGLSLLKRITNAISTFLFPEKTTGAQEVVSNGLTQLLLSASALIEMNPRENSLVDVWDKQSANKQSKPQSPTQAANQKNSEDGFAMAMGTPKRGTYSTLDIHEALGEQAALQNKNILPTEFQEHLQGLLTSVVTKINGPFGSLRADLMQDQAGSPLDVWAKAQATGKAPFTTDMGQLQAQGVVTPDQAMFAIEQIEATVRVATEDSDIRGSAPYIGLRKLYEEAHSKLTPMDFHDGAWATATPQEQQRAQALYDYLFEVEPGKYSSENHLAKFAALGLAHPVVNRALSFKTKARATKTFAEATTWAARLQWVWEKLLDLLESKLNGGGVGAAADTTLRSLVETLVDLEAKHQHRLNAPETSIEAIGSALEGAGAKAVNKGKQAIASLAKSKIVEGSKYGLVRGLGKAADLAAHGRLQGVLEVAQDLRDQVMKGRHGMVAGVLNELRKPAEMVTKLIMSRKREEQQRQFLSDTVSASVMESFANGGRDLTPEQKTAIAYLLLRSGAHNLLEDYTTQNIQRLIEDPAYIDAEIDKLQLALPQQFRDAYLEQAKALAFHNQTGKVLIEHMLMNAHSIAALNGLPLNPSQAEQELSAPIIAKLIPLYTLQNSVDHRAELLEVLRKENQEGTDNGITYTLMLHQQQEQHALETLFNNNPTLMQHGYLPEIVNPHVAVAIVNPGEEMEFVDTGWEKVHRMEHDPFDPNGGGRTLYKQVGGGRPARQTGAFSLNGLKAKGDHNHSGFLSPVHQTGVDNASQNAAIAASRRRMLKSKQPGYGARFDPWNAGPGARQFFAPVINEQGEVVNWRYLMNASTRDAVLERQNDFAKLLGANAASTFDKEVTGPNNEIVINALWDQYQEEFQTQGDRYMLVGPKSKDPKAQEAWALLPESARTYAKNLWGSGGMYVRMDQFHAIFGYQKLTLAGLIQEAYEQRRDNPGRQIGDLQGFNMAQKFLVAALEGIVEMYAAQHLNMDAADAKRYAKRTALLVNKGERAWQEIIAEVKDSIVVKSVTVLVDNVYSNLILLPMLGVPVKDAVHDTLVALRSTMQYFNDSRELQKLETQFASGFTKGNAAQMERRINQLRKEIANNPVTELINAGMLPTIVDDVNTVEDPFSFKSAMTKKVEGKLAEMPESVQKVARYTYLTHDTQAYRMLSMATQLSDFTARYAYYKHLTRGKNPMPKKQARLQAMEMFIHYDVPMQPGLQYMDDHGLMFFTKYFLRVQRVIFHTMQENPARVLSLMLLNNYMGVGPIVQSSSLLLRAGNNPLEPGIFSAISGIESLPVVSAGMALLK